MNRLKELRQAKGFTQAQLSDLTGVSLRTLQKYESGERDLLKAEVGAVIALADALEVTVYELLGRGISEKDNAVMEVMYLMAMDAAEKAKQGEKEEYNRGFSFAVYLTLKDLGFDRDKVERLKEMREIKSS